MLYIRFFPSIGKAETCREESRRSKSAPMSLCTKMTPALPRVAFLSPEQAQTSSSNCQFTQVETAGVFSGEKENTLKNSTLIRFLHLCNISTPHYLLLVTKTLREATSVDLWKGFIFATACFPAGVKALMVIWRLAHSFLGTTWSSTFFESTD